MWFWAGTGGAGADHRAISDQEDRLRKRVWYALGLWGLVFRKFWILFSLAGS